MARWMARCAPLGLGILLGALALAPLLPRLNEALPYPANSVYSDLTLTHWSAFEYARQQIAATGQVPLWRSSILSGTPFAANPLAGLAYPPHWLALFTALPLTVVLNGLVWVHLALAAIAMYALLRRWGLMRGAAWLGAAAFALAPKIVAHLGLGHLTLVEAWAWLPVVVLALTPTRDRAGGSVPAGMALGVCVLADARMAIYAGALALSYLVVVSAQRGAWRQLIGRSAIVVIVAAAISAAVWLPTLVLSGSTSRADLAAAEAGALSLDPIYLLGLLIPDRSGAAERTTYVGVVVLALAVIAALKIDRRRGWLIGCVMVGVVLALGTYTPLYELIYRLPGAALLRVPARAWFVVTFALAILAALGAQQVSGAIKHPARRALVLAGLLGAVLIDVVPVDWAVYRVESVSAAFAPGREAAAWLGAQPGQFRVYSPSLAVPQHVAQQFNVQLADGVDPLQLARYVDYMQQATGVGEWPYAVTLPPFPGIQSEADIGTALKDAPLDAALLGALNVKYIVAAFPIESPALIERARFDEVIIYENTLVHERAFMVQHMQGVGSLAEAQRQLIATAVGRTAIVEGLPWPIEFGDGPRVARVIAWQADRLVLEATGPGWLVIGEVLAPDWEATLDGVPSAIYPTDVALRGVYAPWGTHTIELVYRPRRVYAGWLISVLSLGASGLAVWLIALNQRRVRSVST